ncbi:hypothetical protein [Methylobacterium frigidaeris]|uniref:Uncharacterized protein n=1 Tax=Methylobacterium frigidaeris TaxID=2038277 RepID=A0AA37HJ30_9HYPH|nr:hypothetical protein [Methylobacterium frigidaeris]GJD66722.1 hypothetical protein MPEAHAMD_6920 [Methylobacterium frigidaeris]
MTLQIDFTHDVAARCIEKLTEAGYTPAPADDEEAIYTYVSIRHRRVRPRPRTVHTMSRRRCCHPCRSAQVRVTPSTKDISDGRECHTT